MTNSDLKKLRPGDRLRWTDEELTIEGTVAERHHLGLLIKWDYGAPATVTFRDDNEEFLQSIRRVKE